MQKFVTMVKMRSCALLITVLATTATTVFAAAIPGGATPQQTILSPETARKVVGPRIVIYTVDWCPHCRDLKEYLTSHNIPFINRDVELDAVAMEELTGKYNSKGVPLIVIGNDQEILKGFTREDFEKALARVPADKP